MKSQPNYSIETIEEFLARGGAVKKIKARIPKKYRHLKLVKS